MPLPGSPSRITQRVRPEFLWLVGAYVLSTAGNYLNLVALGLFSYELTGSGLGVGLIMALRLGASGLGGVAAGYLCGRVDRRRVMIGADVVQALAMVVLAFSRPEIVVVAVVVVVLGVGNSVFSVALRTSIPEMVGHEARVRANGLLAVAKSVATVAGFASAGLVIGFGGVAVAFAINGATFLCSALVLTLFRLSTNTPTAVKPAERRTSALPVILVAMVVLRGIDAFASASHNVALPVLAGPMENGAAHLSAFWVAWAVGVLLAHQVVQRRAGAGSRSFAVATCVMAVSFGFAFTGPPTVLWVVVVVVAGIADGVTEIAYTSRLQEAPEHERARLFGVSATAEMSGFAAGTVAAGAALEVLPTAVVVASFHGFALCAAVVFLLFNCLGENESGTVRGT